MAGRQEGYEGSHRHHLHCGGTTGVTDVPGCLTGPPLPQFPCSALGLQPLPAAPQHGAGRRSPPPRRTTGLEVLRPEAKDLRGGRENSSAASWSKRSGAAPGSTGAPPGRVEPSPAPTSEAECYRAKPSPTRTLPSQTERCRAEPELCRGGLRASRALPELWREPPSR